MTWDPELDELRRRTELAAAMGGEEKVARQHDAGKLTVRERIDALVDPGTFHEVGALTGRAEYDEGQLAGFTPANFVMGRARIEGRPVVVGGDDFTVRGGAADASIFQKQVHAEQMANELRLPIVRLVDGSGGGGSVKSLETMARSFVPFNPGLGVGGREPRHRARRRASASDPSPGWAPRASSRATTRSWCEARRSCSWRDRRWSPASASTSTRRSSAAARSTAATAPSTTSSTPSTTRSPGRGRSSPISPGRSTTRRPDVDPTDDPERREDWLIDAIPRDARQVYKVRDIIDAVVDRDSFLEIGRGYGRSAVTGLARLDGWPVAVLAGDPYFYGAGWTADASQKVTRFVDLADTFHLPVVHLVDNPGFVIGVDAERAATIRHGARALAAIYQAQVPWCSVILRKVYGVAGAAHQNAARLKYRFAWPSGDWGSLPLAGGIEAAYKAQLEAADDPEAARAEIEQRLDAARSPFRTAEVFMIEEIVDPRDTRPLLCEFANLAAPVRGAGPTARGTRP